MIVSNLKLEIPLQNCIQISFSAKEKTWKLKNVTNLSCLQTNELKATSKVLNTLKLCCASFWTLLM